MVIGLGLAAASCGQSEPLSAREFFAELTAQNIGHEVVQRPTLTGYEMFFWVCLGEFTERQDCFADDISVLQFNTAEGGWKSVLNETVDSLGGSDFVRVNGNLVLYGWDPRRLSPDVARVIKFFETFE